MANNLTYSNELGSVVTDANRYLSEKDTCLPYNGPYEGLPEKMTCKLYFKQFVFQHLQNRFSSLHICLSILLFKIDWGRSYQAQL